MVMEPLDLKDILEHSDLRGLYDNRKADFVQFFKEHFPEFYLKHPNPQYRTVEQFFNGLKRKLGIAIPNEIGGAGAGANSLNDLGNMFDATVGGGGLGSVSGQIGQNLVSNGTNMASITNGGANLTNLTNGSALSNLNLNSLNLTNLQNQVVNLQNVQNNTSAAAAGLPNLAAATAQANSQSQSQSLLNNFLSNLNMNGTGALPSALSGLSASQLNQAITQLTSSNPSLNINAISQALQQQLSGGAAVSSGQPPASSNTPGPSQNVGLSQVQLEQNNNSNPNG